MLPKDRIIVALDFTLLSKTTELIKLLAPYVGYFKVGLELLTGAGAPTVVSHIRQHGGRVFLDGKFCDIPNTVAGASRAVAELEAKMFTVHASAGLEAIKAAVANKGKSKCLVVTVLTSLGEEDCRAIYGMSSKEKVIEFTKLAVEARADGIVCSPNELDLVNTIPKVAQMLKVTPGIRPTWSASNDQKRTATPAETLKKGASHLVIGRPLLDPPIGIGGPEEAARLILQEISEVAE